MTLLIEARHPGDFIVSEAEGFRSRETAIIAASQSILVGQVLGKTAVGAGATSSAVANSGNAGNGAITLDATTPVLAPARDGVYRAVCIEPAENGGVFAVFDPSGVEIGKVAVGATFATEIKFVIADGATDFSAGDAFSITVGIESIADERYKALDLTATDGSARAAAVAVYPCVTGAGETKRIAIIDCAAELRAADLTWPDGITATQKAAAVEQLRARGVKLR